MSVDDPDIFLEEELTDEQAEALAAIPDASSPFQLEHTIRKGKQAKTQTQEFWQTILDSPIGRQELFKVLTEANTFTPPFACGPTGFPHPQASWFEAGKYAFGQHLFHTWLAMCPEGVVQMLKEHDNRFPKSTPPRRRILKG